MDFRSMRTPYPGHRSAGSAASPRENHSEDEREHGQRRDDRINHIAAFPFSHIWPGMSCLERDADKVTVAPHQARFTDGPKIIERQVKLYWQHVQPFQTNAGSGIRHVADATGKDTSLAAEKQQGIPVNPRSSDRTAFGVFAMENFINCRLGVHWAGLLRPEWVARDHCRRFSNWVC